MKIHCISDLHGHLPILPGGDLLILAGDYTASGKITQWNNFFIWLSQQPYDKKIFIGGNHDNFFESVFPKVEQENQRIKHLVEFLDVDVDFEYLCDSGTEYKNLKIWGTPWTPHFDRVNPNCKYFMKNDKELEHEFNLIPQNIDILISHAPMYKILDTNIDNQHCGSYSLRKQIQIKKPKYFIFGHIHERGSSQMWYNDTWCINCSYVNEQYHPVNSFYELEI